MQTYGGHGFIVDHGMEQFVRDARIAMIYEGTNGVQALDLVGRKLPANMGRSLRRFFHPVAEFIEAHGKDPEIGTLVQSFAKAFGALQLATGFIAQKSFERSGRSRRGIHGLFADAGIGGSRIHVGPHGQSGRR